MSREKEIKICMTPEKEPEKKELEDFWITCIQRVLAEQKNAVGKEEK